VKGYDPGKESGCAGKPRFLLSARAGTALARQRRQGCNRTWQPVAMEAGAFSCPI